MPSGRPKKDKEIISTTVRLDTETHAKLFELVESSFRSMSNQIEMIIVDYLKKLEE